MVACNNKKEKNFKKGSRKGEEERERKQKEQYHAGFDCMALVGGPGRVTLLNCAIDMTLAMRLDNGSINLMK